MGVCHSIDSPIVDVPRKGNVDRNMQPGNKEKALALDVPRKGNVDRNRGTTVGFEMMAGRSPQGERG